jgi:hypothetical protein
MDIIIKLKDCNIVKIDSEMKTESECDYYWNGNDSEIIERNHLYECVTFTFDRGDKNIVVVKIDQESDGVGFIKIVEFFYNKDFSNCSANKFITDFCNHVSGFVYNLEDVGVYYGGWFEYDNKRQR